MYQGYGQQPVRAPQNYFSMQPQQTALKGRPVSSLEEVRATGIDFDGSVFYFPDIANKRIYTKQIGMDGTAILNMYEQKPLPQDYYRDMDRDKGRMYYKERYDTREYPMMRDRREGRSPELRKHYMESKELHHDTAVSMKELESYLNELSKDIVEMVDDATPDEKALLQKKLQTLASKVV